MQKKYIFDRVRKKYIQLTPEEWVRQHTVCYFNENKKVGLGLISIEKGLNFNGLAKRYDIKVFDNKANLKVLVECKAPEIKLTEETFLQSLTYSQSEKPHFIMLTNGLNHIYYDVKEKYFLEDFNIIEI